MFGTQMIKMRPFQMGMCVFFHLLFLDSQIDIARVDLPYI